MQVRHMPQVNASYWAAITLASLFGTNLGDFYAHESGLGIVPGLAILTAIAALVFLAERRDRAPRELYYWLAIIIIRTGATNIADFLAYDMVGRIVPEGGRPGLADALVLALTAVLVILLALFGWLSIRRRDAAERTAEESRRMPATGGAYWAAMLSAGVFGTVAGDVCSHAVGQGAASLLLALALAGALAAWSAAGVRHLMLYWLAVAVARTTGTAMGDWLAESSTANIGLPLATLITGTAFAVVLAWRSRGADRSSSLAG